MASLARRLREGPTAPLRYAFVGPTGAGKSKLFNSVIGREVSPSGFLRPFTRQPVEFVHTARASAVEPLANASRNVHDEAAWRDVVLVDSPDFDSVESAHRAYADRVVDEADGFVFVVDAVKYADRATWGRLRALWDDARPLALVLNKTDSSAVQEDLRDRLAVSGSSGSRQAGREWLVVPALSIADDELLAAPDVIQRLRRFLQCRGPGTTGDRAELRRGLPLRRTFTALVDQAALCAEEIEAAADELRRAEDGIRVRCDALCAELKRSLDVPVEPQVRSELEHRLDELLRRLDVFAYPRKALYYPFAWLRAKLGGQAEPPTGPGFSSDPVVPPRALVDSLLELQEGCRRDLTGGPLCGKSFDAESYSRIRLTYAELDREFLRRFEDFRSWVQSEASATTRQLSRSNKVSFLGAQALFLITTLAVQLQTGGAFTAVELVSDGLLAPVISRWIGRTVAGAEVRAFLARSRERYHGLLVEILGASRDRFTDWTGKLQRDIAKLRPVLKEICSYRDHMDAIVREFESTTVSPCA